MRHGISITAATWTDADDREPPQLTGVARTRRAAALRGRHSDRRVTRAAGANVRAPESDAIAASGSLHRESCLSLRRILPIRLGNTRLANPISRLPLNHSPVFRVRAPARGDRTATARRTNF